MPPSEFVQSIRHREAQEASPRICINVESIGEQVGYPDIHYFSRIFRRHEGIYTRTEYRKLFKIL